VYFYIVTNEEWTNAVNKWHVLDELELSVGKNVFGGVYENAGKACPQFKHLTIGHSCFYIILKMPNFTRTRKLEL
jgi:hypothetical protein